MEKNVDLATVTMKPSEVTSALTALVKLRQPGFVWGGPGVGKSMLTAQLSKALNMQIIDYRALLRDPIDLRGLPIPNLDTMTSVWLPPDEFPKDGSGIFFMDELNAAPPLVQAGCYSLVLDRKVGEYKLPDGWAIIAAGNRETDRAVAHRMPSPLANRFVHLNFEPDLDDWKVWAFNHNIAPELIAFLTWKEKLLYAFNPALNEKAFPTPRSWEFVSNILSHNGSSHVFPLIAGSVGPGAASELMGFIKIYRNLPDPRQVIANPTKADVPGAPDVMFALCGALTSLCDKKTFGAIVKYSMRIPGDFSVLLIRDCTRKDRSVLETKHFIEWAAANADVVL